MSTIGDLTPNDIGNTDLLIQHDGSTVTGRLMHMHIDTNRTEERVLCEREPRITVEVGVTVTLGSITLDMLPCDHAVEVIA